LVENGVTAGLFSGGYMRSPVSRRAKGECQAIRSMGLSHSELTFVRAVTPARGEASSINLLLNWPALLKK
jgi:hypothetical protein